MSAKLIPLRPFVVANPAHSTEVEFSEYRGGESIFVSIRQYGPEQMGIAFWMDSEQEAGLLNWLLARRPRS